MSYGSHLASCPGKALYRYAIALVLFLMILNMDIPYMYLLYKYNCEKRSLTMYDYYVNASFWSSLYSCTLPAFMHSFSVVGMCLTFDKLWPLWAGNSNGLLAKIDRAKIWSYYLYTTFFGFDIPFSLYILYVPTHLE